MVATSIKIQPVLYAISNASPMAWHAKELRSPFRSVSVPVPQSTQMYVCSQYVVNFLGNVLYPVNATYVLHLL